MKTLTTCFALAFSAAAWLSAAPADARVQAWSSCENQLARCLRQSKIPEPCYAQYEHCIRNSAYAPIGGAAGMPAGIGRDP